MSVGMRLARVHNINNIYNLHKFPFSGTYEGCIMNTTRRTMFKD